MVLIFRSAIPNPVVPFKFSQNKKILTNKSELFPEISSCTYIINIPTNKNLIVVCLNTLLMQCEIYDEVLFYIAHD
jgi:hypothetical protein